MNGNFTSTLEVSANSAALLCKEPFYNITSGIISVGEFFIKVSQTDTECIRAFEPPKPELVPYECSRASGVLSFWDNEGEDIYSFEEGEIVQESGASIEEFAAPVREECKEFCNSRGLSYVLEKCLIKTKEIFTNILKLSAELDYFRDDQAENTAHVVIRVEVNSDQRTALREYDRWVSWMAKNLASSDREFFTLTVRRV